MLKLFVIAVFLLCAAPVFSGDIPAADSFAQGMSFFNSKQYSEALPFFSEAVEEKPNDSEVYYYLGYCQYMTGDSKDADVNFYISEDMKKVPGLKSFADKVKNTLSQEDQKWVDDQILLGHPAQSSTAAPTIHPGDGTGVGFGIRTSTSLLLFNLNDFNAALKNAQYWSAVYQTEYSGFVSSYSVPWIGVVPEIEPYLTLDDSLELVLSASYVLMDPVYFHYDDVFLNYFYHEDYNFDVWELGVKVRWYPLRISSGKTRFFLEPGVGYVPVGLKLNINYQNTSYSVPTDNYGANTSASTLAASLKTGLTFEMSKNFTISLTAGYQYAQAQGFSGTYWDKTGYLLDGTSGTLRLYTDPSSGRSSIIFVPNNQNLLPNFHENQSTLTDSRPLSVDMSGLQAGIDISLRL